MTVPIIQRMDNAEKRMDELDSRLEMFFNQLKSSIMATLETLDASMEVVGEVTGVDMTAKVGEKILAKRKQREQAKADAEKKQLEQLVEIGAYKAVDKISPTSVIVARFFDMNGNVEGVGRSQFVFGNLTSEETKAAFLGQGVGFLYEKDGHKAEVLEIYEVAPPAPPAETTEPVVAMPDASSDAPQVVSVT